MDYARPIITNILDETKAPKSTSPPPPPPAQTPTPPPTTPKQQKANPSSSTPADQAAPAPSSPCSSHRPCNASSAPISLSWDLTPRRRLHHPRADCWAVPPPADCEECVPDEAAGLVHRTEWENMNAVWGGLNETGLRDQVSDLVARYEKVMERLDTEPVTFTQLEGNFPVVLRANFVKKLVNMTVPEIMAEYETMAETSQFADIWMKLMLQCNGWDVSPPPWHSPEPAILKAKFDWKNTTQIETVNPILFLSNTLDPVTPLRAAVKMALKFKDAGLIEQSGGGHCTISAASRCTAKVIREYLATGKVPPPPKLDLTDMGMGPSSRPKGEWQRCLADESPWERATIFESEEDRELMGDLHLVRTVMSQMPEWGVAPEKGLDMLWLLTITDALIKPY
ncbi:hypothetical protein N0V88_004911 [Collariella sp. IMI 366227]|nr:hypothetical protein N0V88_004911 [Collariella sp. IMI 366227]